MPVFAIVLLAAAAPLLLFAFSILLLFRICIARLDIPRRVGDRHAFYAPWADEIRRDEAWFIAQEPEDVSILSRDGLRLRAWFLPCANARGALLLLHGYRGDGVRDMAGAARFYRRLGYHVLLPDHRAHGRSEGRYITFGVRERYDCLDWTAWLDARLGGGAPLYLDGVSMGAASALMASALPLPETVRGIIADCGFTTPRAIFARVARHTLHMPPWLLLPPVEFLTRRLAGFGLDDASAPAALAENDRPVLFVHGEADDFIPFSMSEENYAACRGEKTLLLVPGAGHGVSWFVDRPGCEAALRAFFARRDDAE
ncbi:MAG TPA: alpha/beta hydrolase [Oscillospiraceae bacterium]|nr:alpha/beta hydrolase [Oscillospiraceae bacterium]